MTLTQPRLLTTKQAAEYLSMSTSFLERDRCYGTHDIKFIRIGTRAIRYRIEDLEEYLNRQTFKNTSQY